MSEAIERTFPPTNSVRVTFMPEGRTVEFEFRRDALSASRQADVLLDVAENNEFSRSCLRRRLRLLHLPRANQVSGKQDHAGRRR